MYLKGIDKIFIIHYKKLVERKAYIQNFLDKNEIENEIEWIDFLDRDNLDSDFIKEYLGNQKNMNNKQLAVSISHFYVYKKILENNLKNSLILEDDTVFYENFVSDFNKMFKNFPDNYDIIHLNYYNKNFNVKKEKNKRFYKKNKTKTVGSYIVSLGLARKIAHKKLNKVIDHQLNEYSLNIYWLDPPITEQGSKNGKYKSSLKT